MCACVGARACACARSCVCVRARACLHACAFALARGLTTPGAEDDSGQKKFRLQASARACACVCVFLGVGAGVGVGVGVGAGDPRLCAPIRVRPFDCLTVRTFDRLTSTRSRVRARLCVAV